MLCYFILYIIVFYIKFISIISKNNKIISNCLVAIFKAFWQYITTDIIRLKTNISEIKTYHHIFFKNLFTKFILTSRVEVVKFLDFIYKKRGFGSLNKKLKAEV